MLRIYGLESCLGAERTAFLMCNAWFNSSVRVSQSIVSWSPQPRIPSQSVEWVPES